MGTCMALLFGVVLIYTGVPSIEIVRREPDVLLIAIPGFLLIVVGYGLFRLRNWARIGAIVVPIIVVSPLIYLGLISLIGHWIPGVYPTDPRLRGILQHIKPVNAFLGLFTMLYCLWVLFRYVTSKHVKGAFGVAKD